MSRVADQGGSLLVWATRETDDLKSRAEAHGLPLWRMGSGLLGSAGTRIPASLIVDRSGIHSVADRASDLETELQRGNFDPRTLQQARRLRERIVCAHSADQALAIGAAAGQRKLLLAAHTDTDVQWLEQVRSASPDAWIVCSAPVRILATQRVQILRLADQAVLDTQARHLYPQFDEVHTHASISGFEALLHERPVVTYGTPFYAGWGLTRDHLALPRRTRRVTLDELVAAALLRYPRYNDLRTNLPCTAWQALEQASTQDCPFALYRQVCRYLKGMFAIGQGQRD
jgi:capsular polysaccharide export protein